ncbi:nuclease-related domain-containing protein [Actinomadura terrae]|uniref:nuclease-related domain-containing protein n=1 Tax=Actinomadura terrae TaxID=604353 RepID=UPI001FA7C76F|nr:nuclease-related domain-containing protein [Actinomadura terrae]
MNPLRESADESADESAQATVQDPAQDPDQDTAQDATRITAEETVPEETAARDAEGPRAAGALLGDPQIRQWMWRIGIAIVVGAVLSVALGVRLGIAAAVLVVLVDSVRTSRKDSSVAAWKKSSAAERRTEKQLRSLQRNGYLVLHARAVPRDDEGVSDGRIDHLVIGPSGVYAIDSEKWDKRLPVRTQSHLKLFHGPFNKKDRLDEARWEAEQASRIIGGRVGFEVPVQPSVAIYGPSIPWKVMRVRDVDVYAGNRARAYLRRRPKILTETDVQRIFTAAEQALPPKYPE